MIDAHRLHRLNRVIGITAIVIALASLSLTVHTQWILRGALAACSSELLARMR